MNRMSKIISFAVILIGTLSFANEITAPKFNMKSICDSMGESLAAGYRFSDKKKSPEEFCRFSAAMSVAPGEHCDIENIISHCEKISKSLKVNE